MNTRTAALALAFLLGIAPNIAVASPQAADETPASPSPASGAGPEVLATPFIEQGVAATFREKGTAFWEGTITYTEDQTEWGQYPVIVKNRPPVASCNVSIRCDRHLVEIVRPVDPASRLRIAVDNLQGHPDNKDAIDLEVRTPDGRFCRGPVTEDQFHGADLQMPVPWSYEVVVSPELGTPDCLGSPVVGTYEVIVLGAYVQADEEPQGPDDGGVRKVDYRLRARLDVPPAPVVGREMLPDLTAVIPPWNVTLGCLAGDTDRVVGDPSCLRFSFMFGNAGDGMLDLSFNPLAPSENILERAVEQVVHLEDATPWTYEDNPGVTSVAGHAHFHASHRHWHVQALHRTTIHTVEGKKKLSAPISPSGKSGLCVTSWAMADFDRFIQESPAMAASQGCNQLGSLVDTGSTGEPIRIPLPNGWADFYGRNTPDNFVDVSGLPSGEYVLVYEVNPDGAVRELTRANNAAWVQIRYTAASENGPAGVCVLRRGYGSTPWSKKNVLTTNGTCSTYDLVETL